MQTFGRFITGALVVLLGSVAASAQATVDTDNSYPNVGAIMVWSYVCFGDSGGGIFLNAQSGRAAERLVANVSDGGQDCRRHNNNNRLDTRAIQKWIDDTVSTPAPRD